MTQRSLYPRSQKILLSKTQIKDYLGITDYLFRKYLENGMPARVEDGRWMAHADNLEAFFREYTIPRKSRRKNPVKKNNPQKTIKNP